MMTKNGQDAVSLLRALERKPRGFKAHTRDEMFAACAAVQRGVSVTHVAVALGYRRGDNNFYSRSGSWFLHNCKCHEREGKK